MNVKRFVNGKAVTESEFKSLEIRCRIADEFIRKANRRIGISEDYNGRK